MATLDKQMYGSLGADRKIAESGDRDAVASRVRKIFENRGQSLEHADPSAAGRYGSSGAETPDARLARITDQIMSGDRTFGSVRRSVDRASGSDLQTIRSTDPAWRPSPGGKPEPPPLSADDFADLAAQRRAATSMVEQARARREAEAGRVRSDAEEALAQLARQLDAAEFDFMSGASSVGMGRQPRVAGRGVRQLRDVQAQQAGQIERERAEQLAALDRMVNEAELERLAALGQLDAEEARRRADLGRLIQGV